MILISKLFWANQIYPSTTDTYLADTFLQSLAKTFNALSFRIHTNTQMNQRSIILASAKICLVDCIDYLQRDSGFCCIIRCQALLTVLAITTKYWYTIFTELATRLRTTSVWILDVHPTHNFVQTSDREIKHENYGGDEIPTTLTTSLCIHRWNTRLILTQIRIHRRCNNPPTTEP